MSQSTVKKIPNNYFDGMPVTGFHKIVFFIIMMAYFCEQMDNWNFGFIAPALMHTWGLQMSDIGVVTLWYFIGMTAGGFFGGVISDFIGRRKTFLISIATFSFFSVLNGFTDNFHVFVIARSMTGFGVFCLMVCSQAYIAEMAPAESSVALHLLLRRRRPHRLLRRPALPQGIPPLARGPRQAGRSGTGRL